MTNIFRKIHKLYLSGAHAKWILHLDAVVLLTPTSVNSVCVPTLYGWSRSVGGVFANDPHISFAHSNAIRFPQTVSAVTTTPGQRVDAHFLVLGLAL